MRKRTYAASEAAKRAICAALKNRMSQKSLNKITVSEIMRDCGMARQHFYYHFEDIYDAVRWMFDRKPWLCCGSTRGYALAGRPAPAF